MSDIDASCKINDKETLFSSLSGTVSFYHVLELYYNSKHIYLNNTERVKLINIANNKLRDLYMNGIKLIDENDPYRSKFLLSRKTKVEVRGIEPLSK